MTRPASSANRLLEQAQATRSIQVPAYDRAVLRPGIAHIGVGNFHRAHQATYIDDLAAMGGAREWGIRGLGLLQQDAVMRDALRSQGLAYTLTERSLQGSRTRVVGSIVDYVDLIDEGQSDLHCLTDPAVRIVTLTIGEGAYTVPDPADLEAALPPSTNRRARQVHFLDLLYRALKARRAAGSQPFAVASCDNLVRNGTRTRQALIGYAEQVDPTFADWIAGNVSFPNSMVDRITPRTTDEDRNALRQLGVHDASPVVTEPFKQWIIEDEFPAGRPKLEDVGVSFVPDVEPYERAKFRLLNASHQILSYLGGLLGHAYVDDAVSDPLLKGVLGVFQATEASPTLPRGLLNYEEYGTEIQGRFGNPYIADTLERLRFETSTMYPAFVHPIVVDLLEMGGSVKVAATHVAAWGHWLATGRPVTDRREAELTGLAEDDDPLAFLRNPAVFGATGSDARFAQAYLDARALLQSVGVGAALTACLQTSGSIATPS